MHKPVESSVQYLKNDQSLAVYKASVAGGDLIPHEGNYSRHSVSISNARTNIDQLSLHREGFTLVDQQTAITDFYDDKQLDAYEIELENTLSKIMDASEILVFDHTRRSSSAAVRTAKHIRESSTVIHNDYSSESGHVRLQDYLVSTNNTHRTDLIAKEFAIINVWRSAKGTILNHPLAMCDATSVSETDLVPVKREGKERMGELQLMLHNPTHRWCYFPQMTYAEALVFKTFDSHTDGRTRFTAHTSINDPTAPRGAPPRESIESRCFVFY